MFRHKRFFKLTGLFAVAVFAFALGLATSTPISAGEDLCCYIPPGNGCSSAIGVWHSRPHQPDTCYYDVYLIDIWECQQAPDCS